MEDEVQEGKKEFDRYFFVDYENVNRDGLNGITKLTEKDCVRIYYSPSAETLTFGMHRRINASKAQFEYIKVQIPIKNAIDCQILIDLQNILRGSRNANYFIVSKDNDFDRAIGQLISQKVKVKKVQEICRWSEDDNGIESKKTPEHNKMEKLPKKSQHEKREAQIRSFFGQHFKEKVYTEHKEEIIQIVIRGKTKQQVNNELTKIYRCKTSGEVYKKLQPLIKDLPGR